MILFIDNALLLCILLLINEKLYYNFSDTCGPLYRFPPWYSHLCESSLGYALWKQLPQSTLMWKQLMRFLPEWESWSRGPVWLQASAAGAALESAGCSHSSGRRHTISRRRDFSPPAPPPPAACSAVTVISDLHWRKVEPTGHITLRAAADWREKWQRGSKKWLFFRHVSCIDNICSMSVCRFITVAMKLNCPDICQDDFDDPLIPVCHKN